MKLHASFSQVSKFRKLSQLLVKKPPTCCGPTSSSCWCERGSVIALTLVVPFLACCSLPSCWCEHGSVIALTLFVPYFELPIVLHTRKQPVNTFIFDFLIIFLKLSFAFSFSLSLLLSLSTLHLEARSSYCLVSFIGK
jgi:hypothetical protein